MVQNSERDRSQAISKSTEELAGSRFENYYEVLQVDEDYFPDEEIFEKDKHTPKKPRRSGSVSLMRLSRKI